MQLISLNALNKKDRSDFAELLNFPRRKLRRIYAISAYYDHKSIKQLVNYMNKRGASGKKSANLEFVIVLDRGVKVDENLKKLDDKIRKKFGHENSGIYLTSLGALFHSKGYLVESQVEGYCAVGSLNLTQKGLKMNEELIVFSEYRIRSQTYDSKFAGAFRKYVQDIIPHKDTHPVEKLENPKSSPIGSDIRDFFLAGKLYYEAAETSRFGFKLGLPQEFRKESLAAISNYLEAADSLDVGEFIRELDKQSSEQIEGTKKTFWKRYCLQTCYGYWAPNCYEEYIEKEILKKEENGKSYEETFNQLDESKKVIFDKLLGECEKLAGPVLKYMQSNPSEKCQCVFLSEDGQGFDEKRLRQKWGNWLDRKLENREQEGYMNRLRGDVQPAKMPDIWEDRDAVEVFERSFKESFDYEWNKYESNKRRSTNQLLKLLIQPDAIDSPSWEAVRQWLGLEQGDS